MRNVLLPALAGICLSSLALGDVGTRFTYQGKLNNASVPVEGTVSLRFSLHDDPTTGTQIGSTFQPPDRLISGGILQEELDFGSGAFNGNSRWLEIDVDLDGGQDNFQTLLPRVEVLPAPYSIYAETANSLVGGVDDADADSANELNTSLVLNNASLELTDSGGTLTADLSSLAGSTFGDGHSLDASDGDPVDALFVDAEGNVGINELNPESKLHIGGTQGFFSLLGENSEPAGARGVAVTDDGIAYYGYNSGLMIFDLSNPKSPELIGDIPNGTSGFNLIASIQDLEVDNNDDILVISSSGDNAVTIADISTRASPVILSTIVDEDAGFTRLATVVELEIEEDENWFVVTSQNDNAITFIDYTDPVNPSNLKEFRQNQPGLSRFGTVNKCYLEGDLLAVSCFFDRFFLFDVTDPANTIFHGEASSGSGSLYQNNPFAVLLYGDYMYSVSPLDNTMFITDVSTPSSTVLVNTITSSDPDFTILNEGRKLEAKDGKLYIGGAGGGGRIVIADLSDPVNPTVIQEFVGPTIDPLTETPNLGVPGGMALYGDQLIVASGTGTLHIFGDQIVDTLLQVDGFVHALGYTGNGSQLTGVHNLNFDLSADILSLTDSDGTLTADLSTLTAPILSEVLAQGNDAGGSNITNAGTVSATAFSGDGSALTDLPDPDSSNELNSTFSIDGDILSITDAGGTLSLELPELESVGTSSFVFGEAGTTNVTQVTSQTLTTINLINTYSDPVVILGVLAENDPDPTTVRVTETTSTSLTMQVDEWDYLDGAHLTERVSYVVVEAGVYQFPDGTYLEAGNISTDSNWSLEGLSAPFTASPVLIAQVATVNDSAAVVTRLRNISTTDFEIRLQGEEFGGGSHPSETIGYLAIESFASGTIGNLVYETRNTPGISESGTTDVFTAAFSAPPVFLAQVLTTTGLDTASVQTTNLSNSDVTYLIDEEQSADVELVHSDEAIGWLAIESGLLQFDGVNKIQFADGTIQASAADFASVLAIDNNAEGQSAVNLGNVGIGTSTPDYPLHIDANGTAIPSYPGATAGQEARIQMMVNETNETGGGIAISDEGGFFDLNDGYITYLPLGSGLGLSVQGELIVQNNAWPDYVFEENYQLSTLEEIEQHIADHGHLPNVPSAESIHEDGVPVGDMNAILLRQIEEMTLRMIEMKKQQADMLRTIEGLQNEVKSLRHETEEK